MSSPAKISGKMKRVNSDSDSMSIDFHKEEHIIRRKKEQTIPSSDSGSVGNLDLNYLNSANQSVAGSIPSLLNSP